MENTLYLSSDEGEVDWEGYLHKRVNKLTRNWKYSYFRLKSVGNQRMLCEYEKKNTEKPIRIYALVHHSITVQKNYLYIHFGKKKVCLWSKSLNEIETWKAKLQSLEQKNIESFASQNLDTKTEKILAKNEETLPLHQKENAHNKMQPIHRRVSTTTSSPNNGLKGLFVLVGGMFWVLKKLSTANPPMTHPTQQKPQQPLLSPSNVENKKQSIRDKSDLFKHEILFSIAISFLFGLITYQLLNWGYFYFASFFIGIICFSTGHSHEDDKVLMSLLASSAGCFLGLMCFILDSRFLFLISILLGIALLFVFITHLEYIIDLARKGPPTPSKKFGKQLGLLLAFIAILYGFLGTTIIAFLLYSLYLEEYFIFGELIIFPSSMFLSCYLGRLAKKEGKQDYKSK